MTPSEGKGQEILMGAIPALHPGKAVVKVGLGPASDQSPSHGKAAKTLKNSQDDTAVALIWNIKGRSQKGRTFRQIDILFRLSYKYFEQKRNPLLFPRKDEMKTNSFLPFSRHLGPI